MSAACFITDHFVTRAPLSRYRTGILLAACGLLLLIGLSLAQLLVGSSLLVSLISPLTSYHIGEFIKWLFISATVTSALRTCALRFSWGTVLEIIFVASAFVITLSAHRNGMIHRPYFIGDYALMRGIDPSAILMGFWLWRSIGPGSAFDDGKQSSASALAFWRPGMLCFSLLAYVQVFVYQRPATPTTWV